MVIVLRPVYFNAAVLDRSSPGLLPFIKICVQCYIFVGIIQTCLNFLTDPELILCTFLCVTTISTVSLASCIYASGSISCGFSFFQICTASAQASLIVSMISGTKRLFDGFLTPVWTIRKLLQRTFNVFYSSYIIFTRQQVFVYSHRITTLFRNFVQIFSDFCYIP